MEPQANNSVVEPLGLPKIKISGEKAAAVNAFALSFAAFFGFTAIFAAIASFTDGNWFFGIPLIGLVLSNVGAASALVATLLAVACALVGMMTLKKITDKATLAKPWKRVAKVFLILAVIYGITLIGLALYSLMGVGGKSGVGHKNLWLSNFIPNLITGIAAGAIFFFAKKIESGKTEILRLFNLVSIAIAGIGFVMIVISTLVGFYAQKSYTYPSSGGNSYDWSWINDLGF